MDITSAMLAVVNHHHHHHHQCLDHPHEPDHYHHQYRDHRQHGHFLSAHHHHHHPEQYHQLVINVHLCRSLLQDERTKSPPDQTQKTTGEGNMKL